MTYNVAPRYWYIELNVFIKIFSSKRENFNDFKIGLCLLTLYNYEKRFQAKQKKENEMTHIQDYLWFDSRL